MSVTYGHKWKSIFPTNDDVLVGKAVWAQKLGRLSRKQLRRGVEACAYLSDWNPTIAEFVRAACNLPNLDQCISRVMSGDNSDKVSYRVTAKVGSYRMKSKSESDILRTIRSHYPDVYEETLLETMGNDEEFTPAAALPKESEVVTPRADDATAFSHIREMKRAISE